MYDLVIVLLGFGLLLLMSRRFEHTADAGAATLTEDPEASITSLLKLARVNLMPIQWSTTTERWMTHPSMLRRVQGIAAHAELPPERLEEILGRFSAEVAASGNATLAVGDQGANSPDCRGPRYAGWNFVRSTAVERSGICFLVVLGSLLRIPPDLILQRAAPLNAFPRVHSSR